MLVFMCVRALVRYVMCVLHYIILRDVTQTYVTLHYMCMTLRSHLYVSMCESVSIHEVMYVCMHVLAAECSSEQRRQQQQYHRPICKRKASLR